MSPANLQQQVMQLQEQMLEAQEALKDEQVTATSGGGMVTAVANGHQEILSITIDPEVVDPEDVEILQDMVLAAVNEALERSRGLATERMGALTGGLNIPGLM
ncbi:MAG TPA: YbaB/EbfC family nucleoid-associated protein [Anaerolineae bacterium]|nr:YbaB/EbfC family nucleoid-associated protein [Anaerolineae bacterium]